MNNALATAIRLFPDAQPAIHEYLTYSNRAGDTRGPEYIRESLSGRHVAQDMNSKLSVKVEKFSPIEHRVVE